MKLLLKMSKFPAYVVFDNSSVSVDIPGILTGIFILTELIANDF